MSARISNWTYTLQIGQSGYQDLKHQQTNKLTDINFLCVVEILDIYSISSAVTKILSISRQTLLFIIFESFAILK